MRHLQGPIGAGSRVKGASGSSGFAERCGTRSLRLCGWWWTRAGRWLALPLPPALGPAAGGEGSVTGLSCETQMSGCAFICIGYVCILVFPLKENLMKEAGTQSQ